MKKITLGPLKALGNLAIQRHILFVCALVGLVGLLAASDAFHERSQEIFAAVEAIISDYPRLGMIAFVLLASASAMLAFFSSAILVPVGIYTWGFGISLVLLWLGWFIGGVVAYFVGRYLGRVVVARIVGEERLESFELRVNRNTRFIHIVLFQTMLPSEIPGYVLGSIRYRFVPFAIALGIVELPFAVGTIYIGDSFLQQRGWLLVAVAAGGVLLVAVAYAIYRHRRTLAKQLELS
jgi:uncharacterized membrane protein YdjX (TVP38/TMEM64 family)